MLSRNNSFEKLSDIDKNTDKIDTSPAESMPCVTGVDLPEVDISDLPEFDIGDLFDEGLDSPRQLSTVMNMDEQDAL